MPARLTRLSAALLLFILLSACAPAPSLPPSTSTRASPVTPTLYPSLTPTFSPVPLPTIGIDPASLRGVTIQAWQAFSGSANELFSRQAAQFNASNEWGITVEIKGLGDYASLFDSVNSSIDSNESPNLAAALPEQALAWDTSGAVVDLAPYLADPLWGLDGTALADIPAAFLAQDNVNGKVMGLPAQRSARFLYYNRTWAGELGFNTPPATSEEFRRQACAANSSFRADPDPTNDGYGGWIIDTDWQTTYSWLLAFDGAVSDGNVYGFRTDPNLVYLKYLKQLYDDHCAWLYNGLTPFEPFSHRSALFISSDLGSLSTVADSMARANNHDEWELIPFPGPQQQIVVAYGASYTVLKSTPAKQLAAWLFARWLLSPENQAQWVESTALLPLRSSVLNMVSSFRQSLPEWDGAVKYIDASQGIPQLASWRKVRYVLQDGMDTIFQTNMPLDQLSSVLTEMDDLAKELSK
jgi:ABC-type glycerol-3-phosphate transport system substrate-binding protein